MRALSVQSQLNVPLSKLVPGNRNPRKVKPARESHKRLVALIRAHGLLQPLVVRPCEDKPKHYVVVAGNRRLSALREIHKNDGDPKIPCVLRDVDAPTADALSLSENFAREAMHPLDEAEAFAALASKEGKGVDGIAAEFGVTERYVRQRMQLATLAAPVKAAYRAGEIDTGTGEAFASVPQEKQLEVWRELNGHPRHAEQVRNIIANGWIDAKNALFDLKTLPEAAVSRDLFSERVLVERSAFMDAQTQALATMQGTLKEEGWSEVVIGKRQDVQDRLYNMDRPKQEFDDATTRKLAEIQARREKLETKANQIDEGDEAAMEKVQRLYDKLEDAEDQLVRQATPVHSEETKALATAFLILDPDGQVQREYRVPRQRHHPSANGSSPAGAGDMLETSKPLTSDDLSEKQLAATFTQHAVAVRAAMTDNSAVCKRILVLLLHDKIRSEALSIRHEANGTTLHADNSEGFTSPALDTLRAKRAKLDPFAGEHFVDDRAGYERLEKLSPAKLDALIELLTAQCLTAHMLRRTELVHALATELKVDIRKVWRPDAAWLEGFQKIQLAHLLAEFRGPLYDTMTEKRKKSELVDALSKLFAQAAEGKLEDKNLAERVNRWTPANLRDEPS